MTVVVDVVVVGSPVGAVVVVVVDGFGPCPGRVVVAVVVVGMVGLGVPLDPSETGEAVPGSDVPGIDGRVGPGAEPVVFPGSVVDVGRERDACPSRADAVCSSRVAPPAVTSTSGALPAAGAGGLISPRVGRPKVGNGIGPRRGSWERPSTRSPR